MAKTEVEVTKDPKKVNWDNLDIGIQYEGRQITLPGEPAHMPLEKAILALVRKQEDENQTFEVHEVIDAYPLDAAVAFVKAMAKLYGWASPVPTKSFFGSSNPEMTSVKTGPKDDDVIQCPMGAFKIPGVDNKINTTIHRGRFIIYTEVKKKDRHLILELANETRRIVREESIYKGKAIRLHVDSDGYMDHSLPPSFLDVSDITEADLLFDEDIMLDVEDNIFVPICNTEECKKHCVPLKRGVLLSGPFGTGKTLLAKLIAKTAQEKGWTFIMLDRVQGLREAFEFAQRYAHGSAGAIVFAEDIDRIAEYRNDSMNDLANTLDGVNTKGSQIMTILTTNHADRLHQVIVRPGRLDVMITLRPPSARTVEKLIHHYAGDLIEKGTDLTEAGIELAGQIPATIREAVERSKLSMIRRRDDHLIGSDFVNAARTMKNHLALLNKEEVVESDADKLAESLKRVLGGSIDKTFQRDVKEHLKRILHNVS